MISGKAVIDKLLWTGLYYGTKQTAKSENMTFISIRKKLSVLTVNFIMMTLVVTLALSALFTVITAQVLVTQGQKNIRDDLVSKGQILLMNNQISMRRMVGENAFADLNKIVEGTVTSDNDISYGVFVDSENHPWSAHFQNDLQTLVPDSLLLPFDSVMAPRYKEGLINGEEIIEFAAPVFSGAKKVGVIRYGFTTKRINNQVRSFEKKMYLLLFEIFLILLLLLTPLVILELQAAKRQAKEITEPLAQLTSAAKVIREGNISTPIMVDSNDEVGILAQDMEQMRSTLEMHHQALEKRVDDATIQLNSSLKEQLFQSNKLVTLGTLVAGTAHEINNPNNSILLAGRTLERYCNDLLPILDHYADICGDFAMGATSYSEERGKVSSSIEQICRNSHRISSIIRHLKNYGRKDSDGVVSDVNINSVVNDSIEILSREVERSTEKFDVDLDSTIPRVRGIYQQLEQVVVNLLQNACQAVKEKSGSVSISTSYSHRENSVMIVVADTGIGMDEETQMNMFESFFTRKTDQGGTGLGLFVSQRIISEHNGKIRIESELDRGTKAIIVLPVKPKGS